MPNKQTRMCRLNRRQALRYQETSPRPSNPTPVTAKRINVVFEYNELSTTHAGCRFFVGYHSDREVEEQQLQSKEPGSRTKIVAVGMTDEEATNLCYAAIINSGFDSRHAAIETNTDMPDEMKEMELRQLEYLRRLGG